jgi:hypothetical protein
MPTFDQFQQQGYQNLSRPFTGGASAGSTGASMASPYLNSADTSPRQPSYGVPGGTSRGGGGGYRMGDGGGGWSWGNWDQAGIWAGPGQIPGGGGRRGGNQTPPYVPPLQPIQPQPTGGGSFPVGGLPDDVNVRRWAAGLPPLPFSNPYGVPPPGMDGTGPGWTTPEGGGWPWQTRPGGQTPPYVPPLRGTPPQSTIDLPPLTPGQPPPAPNRPWVIQWPPGGTPPAQPPTAPGPVPAPQPGDVPPPPQFGTGTMYPPGQSPYERWEAQYGEAWRRLHGHGPFDPSQRGPRSGGMSPPYVPPLQGVGGMSPPYVPPLQGVGSVAPSYTQTTPDPRMAGLYY